jgi:hypothetical protein
MERVGVVTVNEIDDICRMVRKTVAAGREYMDSRTCTALLEAANRGDLPAVHDLLVANMIKLRGASFTCSLLQDIDQKCASAEPRAGYQH